MHTIGLTSLKPKNYQNTCPNIGEILREAAAVLETKTLLKDQGIDKDLDSLARNEKHDYKLIANIVDTIFQIPKQLQKSRYNRIVIEIKRVFIPEYLSIIKDQNYHGIGRSGFNQLINEEIVEKKFYALCSTILPNYRGFVRNFINDKAKSPIQHAFDWLTKSQPNFSSYRNINSIDRELMENSLRWMKGEQVPKIKDLIEFLEDFVISQNIDGKDTIEIFEVFFTAKIIYNYRAKTKEVLTDIEYNVPQYTKEYITSFEKFENLMVECYQIISPDRRTEATMKAVTQKIEQLNAHIKGHSYLPWWSVDNFKAQTLILNGKFEEAIQLYEEVVSTAFYNGDSDSKTIYLCALSAIAYAIAHKGIKCRPRLLKLKQFGIMIGAYGSPLIPKKDKRENFSVATKQYRSDNHILEDWEVDHWALCFFDMFPRDLFFIDVTDLPKPKDVNIITYDLDNPPVINIKKPNTVMEISGKKYPPIIWAIEQGDYVNFEKLILKGAKVDKLSSSGESALILAIQHLNPTVISSSVKGHQDKKSFFKLLSQKPHAPKTVNIVTSKRKLTALGCAIHTGDFGIVEKVIEMGAEPDFRSTTDNATPLYLTLKLNHSYKPSARELDKHLQNPSIELLDSIRRECGGLLRGNNQEILNQLKNPDFRKHLREVFPLFIQDIPQKNAREFTLKTLTLLLEKGANPNEPHNLPGIYGYTPLMFAAEQGDLELFKMLHERGGKPKIQCEMLYYGKWKKSSCWDIARHWGKTNILEYLNECML